jgi:hypothetical protein
MAKFKGFADRQGSPPVGEPYVPTLAEMTEGLRAGVAAAVEQAHARGLPFFEADNNFVYAIYPDGTRTVIEHLSRPSKD